MRLETPGNIKRIIEAHFYEGMEVKKEIGSTGIVLRGISIRNLIPGISVVTLLDPSSTPYKLVISADIEAKFEEAGLRIISGEWKEFFTMLRPGWSVGFINWRKR